MTLTSTATRAINIETEGKVVINNLTVNAAERAFNIINKPATVELNGVTATASNNAVMIATSAGAAKVTIDGCDFTGLAVVNVAGAESQVDIKNSKITNVDATDAENYGAITVWTSAENAVVNVENTTITVADDSKKAYVFPANATVNGVDEVGRIIVTVGDAGYDTLKEAVEKANGTTIKFVIDAVGPGVVINKDVTIDFNGKTYTFNEGVGSTGTPSNGFQILKGNTVTLKNGTLNVASEAADKFYILIQNYADLTVENMNLDGTNLDKWSLTDGDSYVLSNNSGTVNVIGSTITANNDGELAFALDACLKAPYDAPVVTVAEGSTINGNVEVSATLNMNGTLNGAVVINGANGVVNSANELNVTTNVASHVIVRENGKYYVVEKKSAGKVAYRADVTDKAEREGIAILLKDVYAKNSVVVKVYNGETLMFTCSRRDIDDEGKVMFPVDGNTTANIVLWGKESGSWINEIHVVPTELNVPDKIEVYADDVLTDSYTHESGTVLGTNLEKYLALECVKKAVAKVGDVKYMTLAGAVAAGDEVTLLADATGAGVVIDKDVVIDFGGFTYSFNEGVGSTGTPSNGFQILNGNTVTLKNGTLNVAPEAAGKFYILVQNYADLTVEDMNLDGTNLDKWSLTDGDSYVLSNNSGDVIVKGNTNITANNDGELAFAFDACKNGSYEAPVVTVETTGYIAGKIENSATIVIKNGTFSVDPTAYLAKGYISKKNDNNTYSVVADPSYLAELTLVDGEFNDYAEYAGKTVGEFMYIRKDIPATWTPFYVPFPVEVDVLAEQGLEIAYINGVRRSDNDEDGEFDSGFSMELILIHGGKGNANGLGKTLKANYPYFIRRAADVASADLTIELEDIELPEAKSVTYDCTTFAEKFEITGTVSKVTINSSEDALRYVVSRGEWSKRTIPGDVKPFRFYMTLTSRDGGTPYAPEASMSIVVRGEERPDGTTLIYDVEAESGIGEDVIFDLQGRRVLEVKNGGLYIKGGKKVLVK